MKENTLVIKVFNYSNLNEALDKRPIICYRSENGACGPSGLFFVVFSDKTCYAYSTYYKKSDTDLIHSIIEHVPEIGSVLGSRGKFNLKRERYNGYEDVYLGMGNYALIELSLLKEMNEYGGQYPISDFMQLVEKNIDDTIRNIFELTKNDINK